MAPKRSPPSPRLTEKDLFRLLRYSHIFASAVRETLDVELLRTATSLPLTTSQVHVLKLMAHNGSHQVGEIADFLGVSPPAATRNIDKLEHHGLVVRAPCEDDRRATLLSVSPKGRRLVARLDRLKETRLAPVLAELDPSEVRRLAELLERFSVSLLRKNDLEGGFCLRCAAYLEDDCPVGRARGSCPYQQARERRTPVHA
jgi:DNA-binding MarR family transcriptional regulator